MRYLIPLALLVGCGPHMEGKWVGNIGTVADTWTISDSGAGKLQILSLQTCTKWDADQQGTMATWATPCGEYFFSGNAQLDGDALNVSVTFRNLNGQQGTLTGALQRQ